MFKFNHTQSQSNKTTKIVMKEVRVFPPVRTPLSTPPPNSPWKFNSCGMNLLASLNFEFVSGGCRYCFSSLLLHVPNYILSSAATLAQGSIVISHCNWSQGKQGNAHLPLRFSPAILTWQTALVRCFAWTAPRGKCQHSTLQHHFNWCGESL